MPTPPGVAYLLRLIPFFAVPSGAVYVSLRFLQEYKPYPITYIPSWFIVVSSIFARPVLFFVKKFYNDWADKRAAAQLGAALPPNIEEGAFKIIQEMIESTRIGYPGMCFRLL